MKIISTNFSGLKLINNNRYKDNRGFFREISLEKKLKKKLPFCYVSSSKKNVIRGLHLQKKNQQAKLITVLDGKIFDVAVDLRKKSKTYKKYFKIVLSSKDDYSIFIPEGFAHGFMSISPSSLLLYQCSKYRNKTSEIGIKWNDKDLSIEWPKSKKVILSLKDKKNISLREFIKINKN